MVSSRSLSLNRCKFTDSEDYILSGHASVLLGTLAGACHHNSFSINKKSCFVSLQTPCAVISLGNVCGNIRRTCWCLGLEREMKKKQHILVHRGRQLIYLELMLMVWTTTGLLHCHQCANVGFCGLTITDISLMRIQTEF